MRDKRLASKKVAETHERTHPPSVGNFLGQQCGKNLIITSPGGEVGGVGGQGARGTEEVAENLQLNSFTPAAQKFYVRVRVYSHCSLMALSLSLSHLTNSLFYFAVELVV